MYATTYLYLVAMLPHVAKVKNYYKQGLTYYVDSMLVSYSLF